MTIYISVLSSVFVLNFLGFFLGYFFKTDKFTDITYSLSFICASFISLIFFSEKSISELILVGMVIIWALRLGSFLLSRILNIKRDERFDSMRSSWIKFGSFWLLQAVSVCIIIMPVIISLDQNINEANFSVFQIIGIVIWSIGFIIESLADYQKSKFKKQNSGQLMTSGLYSWVRYPNYLGEILVWTGIWIYGANVYSGWMWISVISPLWIFILLRYISGIPLVEKSREEKYEEDKDYQQYKSNTKMLFPY